MKRLKNVLIVEDDDNDAFLIERAFRKAGFEGRLTRCKDAVEAINFLSGYRKSPLYSPPEIVLTDLKMPVANGFDLLRWIKENPDCMVVPTIVLSSSNQVDDVKNAYCLGANAYLMKSSSMAGLQQQLEALVHFWSFCEKPQPGVHSPCGVEHRHAA